MDVTRLFKLLVDILTNIIWTDGCMIWRKLQTSLRHANYPSSTSNKCAKKMRKFIHSTKGLYFFQSCSIPLCPILLFYISMQVFKFLCFLSCKIAKTILFCLFTLYISGYWFIPFINILMPSSFSSCLHFNEYSNLVWCSQLKCI